MARLIKNILLFLLPLIIISACYVITDPFKTIYSYTYYKSTYILLSRGNVSTMMLLKNRDKYHYDSFIFGSSRATAYTAREWAKYLPAKSSPFAFEAWNENVKTIYERLHLLDSLHTPIKNALIILDADRAFKYFGDVTADHYLIKHQSEFDYYKQDYFYYLKTPRLFLSSIDFAIFKKQRNYMDGFVGMNDNDIDPVTNDWFPLSENAIQRDSVNYYKGSERKFYKRQPEERICYRQINRKQLQYLQKIAALLIKHHTNYKIVISPLYNQVKLNPYDLFFLNSLFPGGKIYDYSGINKITNNKYNYNNDVIHYRKKAGNIVLRELYR